MLQLNSILNKYISFFCGSSGHWQSTATLYDRIFSIFGSSSTPSDTTCGCDNDKDTDSLRVAFVAFTFFSNEGWSLFSVSLGAIAWLLSSNDVISVLTCLYCITRAVGDSEAASRRYSSDKERLPSPGGSIDSCGSQNGLSRDNNARLSFLKHFFNTNYTSKS